MSNVGGRRPGAGRPKGVKNKGTKERLSHADELRKKGQSPLEYLLKVMRDESADEERRLDAAKSAAPYVHPRLAQTDLNVNADLNGASDAAVLAELRELLKDPEIAGHLAAARAEK